MAPTKQAKLARELLKAAASCQADRVRKVLHKKDFDKSISKLVWDKEGYNAVTFNVKKGRLDVVQALQEEGIDVKSAVDGCGRTPLYVAAVRDDVEMTKYLVEELNCKVHHRCHITNPRPLTESLESPPTVRPQDTVTPWDASITYRASKVQSYLSSFYDDIFFDLVKKRDVVEVKMLAENPRINRDFSDFTGWTPLHWAMKNGDERIARILILAGFNFEKRNMLGETPFDVARGEGNMAICSSARTALMLAGRIDSSSEAISQRRSRRQRLSTNLSYDKKDFLEPKARSSDDKHRDSRRLSTELSCNAFNSAGQPKNLNEARKSIMMLAKGNSIRISNSKVPIRPAAQIPQSAMTRPTRPAPSPLIRPRNCPPTPTMRAPAPPLRKAAKTPTQTPPASATTDTERSTVGRRPSLSLHRAGSIPAPRMHPLGNEQPSQPRPRRQAVVQDNVLTVRKNLFADHRTAK